MHDSQGDSSNKIQTLTNSAITSIVENRTALLVILGFVFALFINAIIVDMLLFFSQGKNSNENLATQSLSAVCPQSCIGKFSDFVTAGQPTQNNNSTTSSASTQNAVVGSPTISPSQTPTPTLTPTQTPTPSPTPGLREYYIPLGQGNGNFADWTVVLGMGATINPANYGNIQKVYFEVTTRIPNGSQEIWVRLYNSNTYQFVPNSDFTTSVGAATLFTSKEISLGSSEALFQVQLKTQLQVQTYIDQARIRIVSR